MFKLNLRVLAIVALSQQGSSGPRIKVDLHRIGGPDVVQHDASVGGASAEDVGFDLVELDGVDGVNAPVELLHRQVPAGVPQHGLLAAGGELLAVPVVGDPSYHGLESI